MIGSLWVGRRGAPSKVGFDHVGDDGTRLGEVEGGDGRIHLEHLTKRLNRLWIHMTARIRFNIPTGTKGPVMNGEALFR